MNFWRNNCTFFFWDFIGRFYLWISFCLFLLLFSFIIVIASILFLSFIFYFFGIPGVRVCGAAWPFSHANSCSTFPICHLQIAAKFQQPLIRSIFIALFSTCRVWRIAIIYFSPKHFPHFGTYFRSPPNPRICALCIINQIHAPGPKVGIQILNFSPIFRHNWFNLSASFSKNCPKALPR